MKPLLLLSAFLLVGCESCKIVAVPEEVTEELEVCTTEFRVPIKQRNADGSITVDPGFVSEEDKANGYGCETELREITHTIYHFNQICE